MRFLNKIGYSTVKDHYIEDLLKPMENKYLEYSTKLTPEKTANDDDGDNKALLVWYLSLNVIREIKII